MHQAASGDPRIGRLGRARATSLVLGPAFVAAVAYVDPGNFATNFSAGAQFGYSLVWVVVLANLVAMLVQQQSAKLGVASGRDLAENCREHFPRPVSRGLWVQAELVTMATDVAEIVGAAVGLHLLFGVPLFAGWWSRRWWPSGCSSSPVAATAPSSGPSSRCSPSWVAGCSTTC